MQYRIAEVIMGMGEMGVEIKAKLESRAITQIQSYVLVIPLLTPKEWNNEKWDANQMQPNLKS